MSFYYKTSARSTIIVWTLILVFMAASLIPINISARAQTSNNNNNYANECIRLGISLDKCTELEVLKHRGGLPREAIAEINAKITNWWITIAIIAAVLGGSAFIFMIRSNMRNRNPLEHR